MREEPLYVLIERTLKPGDRPRTAAEIGSDFERSEDQAKKVLDWMSNGKTRPSMAEVPGSNPKQWVRI